VDFDGDTYPDVSATRKNGNVALLFNKGDGTFQEAIIYEVAGGSIFCTDVDGDHDFDIATVTGTCLSLLLNNGDGTFQTNFNYGLGGGSTSLFCADLDGDSDLDVAATYSAHDNVYILKNLTQASANHPPNAFLLLSPGNGSNIFDQVNLRWQTVTDPNYGDQISYEAYISTSSVFHPDSTIVDSNLIFSKITHILDIGTYFWKVKAKDNWGAERWSTQTWSFNLFFHGDVNADGNVTVTDLISLIDYLFKSGPEPIPVKAGDFNCNGEVNIVDAIYLLNYLFKGWSAPCQ
jgi:hypothetical protein